jgi:hypothetical protein
MASRSPANANVPAMSGVAPGPSDRWILNQHDAWSRATLSPLHLALAHGTLHPDNFARWLLDRASIARALAAACTRVEALLAGRIPFPLLALACEEAEWLEAYATQHGLDLRSRYRLSYEAAKLVDLIDSATAARPPQASDILRRRPA